MMDANTYAKVLGALDPSTIQVDERTLLDRLNFAASYAELINFYDKHNRKNGNWRPFLLKDPMILLAAISKTDYSAKHLLFILLNKKLETVDWSVGRLQNAEPAPETSQYNGLFEQLFALIQSLFVEINDWLIQMETGRQSYLLKEFVNKNVGEKLSPLLWQFLTLRRTASQLCRPEVAAPDYPLFADFHPLWRSTVNNETAQYPEDANLLSLAQQLYRPLFSFYMQVIDSAKNAFDELKGKNLNPPDTALLIAFIELMEVQQRQLNQMTEKHLQFYYRDILKQRNKPVSADETYLCLTLKKDVPAFNLPAGTKFNAGADAQQQPILFANLQAQTLNRIALNQVKTLRYCAVADPATPDQVDNKLFLNIIDAPAAITKDPQGHILSWPLLGCDTGTELKQGFAFASPILSLQNGERNIGICFEAEDEFPDNYFDGCEVYLSTEKDWFNVPFALVELEQRNRLRLSIKLGAGDPAIAKFAKNPDGFNSQWPLFKLVLSNSVDLTQPPRLTKLAVAAEVDQFGAFELYNDNGKLDANSPFLPFGPIPAQGDSVYLGGAELFAKPLASLSLNVQWDNLPDSLADYYRPYNNFLTKSNFEPWVAELCQFTGSLPAEQRQALCDAFNAILGNNAAVKFAPENISSAKSALTDAIKKQYPDSTNPLRNFLDDVGSSLKQNNPLQDYQNSLLSRQASSLFANQNFKIAFSIWNESQWQKVPAADVAHQAPNNQATPDNADDAYQVLLFNTLPQPAPVKPTVAAPQKNYGLKFFGFGKNSQQTSLPEPLPEPSPLLANDVFEFKPSAFAGITPNPALLAQPLDFSKADKTGFLSIKLQQPGYGFGNSLYGLVVTDVTQQNAFLLNQALSAKTTYVPIPSPNAPFAPKIAKLSVSYSAGHCVDFSEATTSYPFELYHYDNFSIYPVYDGNGLVVKQSQSPEPDTANGAIRLFPGLGAPACLYLGLENVQAPCNLTLYFELTQLVAPLDGDQAPTLDFYYLADSGWKKLKILADGTDNLSDSGIIEVLIGADISANNPLMPGSSYWLAIACNNPAADFANVAYLNTQAIKVKRINPQGPAAPQLDAGKITAPTAPLPQVEALLQPFASFSGLAAEDDKAFYQRVSQRIKTKDRGSSQSDYELIAFKALPGLYFCKYIAGANTGEVKLGLVNGYADPMSPDAYRPVVSRQGIDNIRRYFSGRISPFVRLNLFNLSHESVKIEAKLKFADTAPANRLCQEIAQQLKIYLSPWIQSELPQIAIDEGISSAALIDYLTGFPEVDSVDSLTVIAGTRQVSDNFVIRPEQSEGLFVSAPEHDISAAGEY